MATDLFDYFIDLVIERCKKTGRLQVQGSGSFSFLVGIPFVLFGAFAAISPILGVQWYAGNGSSAQPTSPLIPGALFIAVGIAIMIYRDSVSLDLRTRTCKYQRGWFPFDRRRNGSIDELAGVFVRTVKRPNSADYLTISTRWKDDEENFFDLVQKPSRYPPKPIPENIERFNRLGQMLADVLKLPFFPTS